MAQKDLTEEVVDRSKVGADGQDDHGDREHDQLAHDAAFATDIRQQFSERKVSRVKGQRRTPHSFVCLNAFL